jgi:hypothetical protein
MIDVGLYFGVMELLEAAMHEVRTFLIHTEDDRTLLGLASAQMVNGHN